MTAARTTDSAEARIVAAFNALRIIDRPRSTASEVAEALESDPGLSAQLLRMARSPLFGVRSDELTVGRAVVLLGFLSVRKMAVLQLGRELTTSAAGAEDTERWKRALWRGISAEQIALRVSEDLAADALMSGILQSFSNDFEAAGVSRESSIADPAVQRRLETIVDAAEAIAAEILDALPGLPTTATIDDCLVTAGLGRADGRLAVDIRRAHDLYASLFG